VLGLLGALAAALVLVVAMPAPIAAARLVGQFDAGLRDIKTYGAYTIEASTRVYETSGQPPPELTSAVVHFPRGAGLRRQFLVSRFFCNPARLMRTPDPAVCKQAHFASGTMMLDARPTLEDAFPVNVDLFLAKGTMGATASVAVLVKSNQNTPVYDYQVLQGFLFSDAGVNKRFGYRLQLPTALTPLLPEVELRLAELELKIRGLVLRRRVRRCVRHAAGRTSRCLERRRVSRPVFWIKTPHCPPSRKVTFGADYQFQGAAPVFKRRRVSCRQFLHRRTVHRKGRIPGAP
jgi:hypothetical protein